MNLSKPMTWKEVCRFREQRGQITTLTSAQIVKAERICDRFGAWFAGIRDRVDWVKREVSEKDKPWARPNGLNEAVQELVGSINPSCLVRHNGNRALGDGPPRLAEA